MEGLLSKEAAACLPRAGRFAACSELGGGFRELLRVMVLREQFRVKFQSISVTREVETLMTCPSTPSSGGGASREEFLRVRLRFTALAVRQLFVRQEPVSVGTLVRFGAWRSAGASSFWWGIRPQTAKPSSAPVRANSPLLRCSGTSSQE